MTVANVDPRLADYVRRAVTLEKQRRDAVADLKDLKTEMKNADPKLTDVQISGVFIAMQRDLETSKEATRRMNKETMRTAAEEVADMLAASGAPLFSAVA